MREKKQHFHGMVQALREVYILLLLASYVFVLLFRVKGLSL